MIENAVSLFTREWIEIVLLHIPGSIWQVSLFTREWIEITLCRNLPLACPVVSLFTREWIEIGERRCCPYCSESLPLYEGVDWNACTQQVFDVCRVSLFTREWIEIDAPARPRRVLMRLPLYEGVDWNWCSARPRRDSDASPSLRGSGLKLFWFTLTGSGSGSPSLRGSGLKSISIGDETLETVGLPLYEGVDWNGGTVYQTAVRRRSPSLRGSGLK